MTAWRRFYSTVNPERKLEGLAKRLNVSPMESFWAALFGLCIIIAGTNGYQAVFGTTAALAAPAAITALALQLAFKSWIRPIEYGWILSGVAAFGFSICVVANIVFAAGGIAAYDGKTLGRAFIRQQLAAPVADAHRAVDDLARLNAKVAAIAQYSLMESNVEQGLNGEAYARTCAISRGRGDGPANAVRVNDQEMTSSQAKSVEAATQAANTALARVDEVVNHYDPANHVSSIEAIKGAITKTANAIQSANASGVILELSQRLDQDSQGRPTQRYGLVHCPDSRLAQMLRDAITTRVGNRVVPFTVPTITAFVEPPPPDEKNSVFGLAFALPHAVFRGDWDSLAPWTLPLTIAPSLDAVFLFWLYAGNRKLGRKAPAMPEVTLARRISRDIDPAAYHRARFEALNDPIVQALDGHTWRVLGRFFDHPLIVTPERREEVDPLLARELDGWILSGRAKRIGVLPMYRLPPGETGAAVADLAGPVCVYWVDPSIRSQVLDERTRDAARRMAFAAAETGQTA